MLPNGERIKERGLGKILAVASLINDIDVIGTTGGNIGFQIISHPTEGVYAQTIKIDTEEAFAKNEVSNSRKIRVAITGTPQETELEFNELPNETKKEFLEVLKEIAQTTEMRFRGFFAREGTRPFLTYYKLTINELTKFLMDRKAKLMRYYGEFLENPGTNRQEEQKVEELKEHFEKLPREPEEEKQQAFCEEFSTYIDPYVVDQDNPNMRIFFIKDLTDFLHFDKENTATVMLLKGVSGSGKSLSLRFLEQKLLEERKKNKEAPIRIYIDLKTYNKEDVQQSFERTLKEEYFNKYDPNLSQLVVLMDGYDEISGECQVNLYDIQQLDRYSQNLRVIISCNTQYLTPGYQKWFKPVHGLLKELEIKQFDDHQISEYLNKYSDELELKGKKGFSFRRYQKNLKRYPSLKDLIGNPFLLRLVVKSLPYIDDYIKSRKLTKFNKFTIYECYMEHWFAEQEERLSQSSGISDKQQAVQAFRRFLRRVALKLLSKQACELKINEQRLWDIYFDDHSPDMERDRCPLRRQNDHQYSFIHRSFLEYFAACGILDIIADITPHEALQISPELITRNMGVISFIRDAFVLDPDFKVMCFDRIYGSKDKFINPSIPAQAAIAITILNTMNFDFSKLDLSGVSIPNANLSHGIFEGTNFTKADLTNVSFANAWLKDANFKNANLTGVNFGEWVCLEVGAVVKCISISENGEKVAVAAGSSTTIFERDAKTGKIQELKTLQDKSGSSIEYCKLNSCGKQVITCSKGGVPCVWNISAGNCILELPTGVGYEAATFDFSPDGKQVVFSAENNTLRIWNLETNTFTHEFKGHKDYITCCKFSPDGTQVISGSVDKTLRIWDVVGRTTADSTMKLNIQKRSLNLSGACIEDAIGLSEANMMLLHQRGALGISEREKNENLIEFFESFNQSQANVKLSLNEKSIDDHKVKLIVKCITSSSLECLDLTRNNIGAKGAEYLSKNTTWNNLQTLDLSENYIGDEGAEHLSKNTTWNNLQILDLSWNNIGAKGAECLSKNTIWNNLQTLDLSWNIIGDKGAEHLSKNTIWINLQTLDLGGNIIGDKGADYLSKNSNWINLQTLNLFNNNIGAKGAEHLSKNTIWNNLQTLNLSNNNIGDEGADYLSKNSTWTNLQTFNLFNNNIGAKGAEHLSKNTKWNNLKIYR